MCIDTHIVRTHIYITKVKFQLDVLLIPNYDTPIVNIINWNINKTVCYNYQKVKSVNWIH